MTEPTPCKKEDRVFLATTALEDFWNTSGPIVFLGEGCRRYSRRHFWEPLGGEVVRSPWEKTQAVGEAYCHVKGIYERLLPILSEALNSIHATDYKTRYWRIVIGAWFWRYIAVVYDRYMCLRVAFEQHPDFVTIGLSEESFVTPSDTADFAYKLNQDSYNLQLYTRILESLGKEFPCKQHKLTITEPRYSVNGVRWSALAKQLVKRSLALVQSRNGMRRIALKDAYFPRYGELELLLKARGKVWPVLSSASHVPAFPLEREMRSSLRKIFSEDNDFEVMLSRLLPLDVPQVFLEGFKWIATCVQELYPATPMAVFSANAWYYDEPFKQWAAAAAGKGAVLIGTQHSPSYGTLAYLPAEEHELAITDRYYTWGWERSDCHARLVPFSATKLAGRKPIVANNQKAGILMTTTSMPRYLIHFPFVVTGFEQYLAWQLRFINALAPEIREAIRVRLYQMDFGWDIDQRWKDQAPGVQLETWKTTFLKSLESCRLYVCDHLSTTFAEALSANKPTVLFWDREKTEVRPQARSYFDELRDAGILYDGPEPAAAAVCAAYPDVEAWWEAPHRQAARRRFCARFANTSPNAIDEWAEELKDVADGLVSASRASVTKHG